MLIFDVGSFLAKPQGARENFKFEEEINVERLDGKLAESTVSGSVQLLKLPHEINVQIKNFHAVVKAVCKRCLKQFDFDIRIPLIEREFIIDLPAFDLVEGEDVKYVNKDRNEIDITDVLRDEILLHFPHIEVCSESCKGLCDKCGANLNEKTCACTRDTELKVSPFKFPKA